MGVFNFSIKLTMKQVKAIIATILFFKKRSTYERATAMTIDTIGSATKAVEELLKRHVAIEADGALVPFIVEELGGQISSTLVAAALEELARDKKIELTKTKGKYNSLVFVGDGGAFDMRGNDSPPKSKPARAVTTVTDDEVKRAYDALCDIAEEFGVVPVTSCTEYIREQLTVPKGRAGTINKLLFNIGLRDSTKLGGGKMSHRVSNYPKRASLEEISDLLRRYRASVRKRHADKATEGGTPAQLELPDDGFADDSDVAAKVIGAYAEYDAQTLGMETAIEPQPEKEVDAEPEEDLEPRVETADDSLTPNEAVLFYLLLGVEEAIRGTNLTVLAAKIRAQLRPDVRTRLNHLLIEMIRPE